MDEQKNRDDAIERIGQRLEEAETAKSDLVVNISVEDLNLMFDEIDRLRERENDAYNCGLEIDLIS